MAGTLSNADKTEAVMTSTLTFAKDVENANYRLAFALVADGLKNDKWAQSNYYAGDDDDEGDGVDSPLWDVFLTGGKTVKGLTFNDVVVYMKEVDGIEGSVPAAIKAGEAMKYEYRVPMADVKNLKGHCFINEGASVHAVAILLDAETGYAVNCNKSANLAYSNAESGIRSLDAADAEVVRTEFHNLQGVCIDKPAKGIYIRTEVLSDGTRRTSKVTVK